MAFVTDRKGITLIELLVAITVIGFLTSALVYNFDDWMTSFNKESQVKEMYSDLLNARGRAIGRNRTHFVEFTTTECQTWEDVDSSGGTAHDAGDDPSGKMWPSPKKLQYKLAAAANVIFETKGLVRAVDSGGAPIDQISVAPVFRFDGRRVDTDYDCIKIEPTRLKMGKMKAGVCDVPLSS